MSADEKYSSPYDDDSLQDMIPSAEMAEENNEQIFQVFKPSQAVWKNFEWLHGGGNIVRVIGPHVQDVLSYLDENIVGFESRITVEIREGKKRHRELYIIYPLISRSDGAVFYRADLFDEMIAHFDQPHLYAPLHLMNPEHLKREDG